ncbi:hypothetical protein DSTSK_20370 [Desulforhabdus sp. TSK]|nr:hypothetical protein DSTSK_20370 [Desulforhabdus sp. TSK]
MHGVQDTESGRGSPHEERKADGQGVQVVGKSGEAKIPGVKLREALPEPYSHARSQQGAPRRDGEGELQVMESDFKPAVPESLQGGDLLALGVDEAREDDMDDESSDRQEDGGRDDAHAAQLLHFVGDQPVRELILPAVGPQPPVRLDEVIQPVQNLGLQGAGHEGEADVVEGPFQAVRGGELLVIQPEYPEAPVIGHDVPGPELIDEFG